MVYRVIPKFKGNSKCLTTCTSVFDPVLCEIVYKWFCKDGGVVLDPFCGGSVRGIVALKTGHKYVGFDLREEQIQANIKNAEKIGVKPQWICDDSLNMDEYINDNSADLVFTCPPYVNLEKYSDLKNDLSNMKYDDFKRVFSEIISKSVAKLKDNRFFVIVVGEVRQKNGEYYNFVGDTVNICKNAGLSYYDEVILNTPVVTAAYRANSLMNRNRKVVKIHQNVLVFYKGNVKAIGENFEAIAA